MPKLSLTDLVDIVSSSGVPKASKIAQIKARPEYEPQFDFYKPLREAIQLMHQKHAPKSELDKLRASITDKKKLDNYPSAIKGYKKWLGKKAPNWFDPPRSDLSEAGVDVITCAMEDVLRPLVASEDKMSLIDVRQGKMFTGSGESPKLRAIVGAELAYIAHLWPTV